MTDIGSSLRDARIARGLEIKDIARRTCISSRYLEAMEEGRFQVIPKVYDRGWLRLYASFLGMDPAMIVSQYEATANRVLAEP